VTIVLRFLPALAVVAVTATACGSGQITQDTFDTVVVDGPPAPDFSLALADGTDFTLSAEQKPVYMVFWAEW
jgi:hypothetical protein